MGKAANNEALKLRGTFFNNLAVGCVLAGVAAPFFSVYANEKTYNLSPGEVLHSNAIVPTLSGLFVARCLAAMLRRPATRSVSKIQD